MAETHEPPPLASAPWRPTRSRAVLAAASIAVLIMLGAALWIGRARQAAVPAAEADRIVRLVGRAPWFTNDMVSAQDSTITYAGMALHARVIGARISPDTVWLQVQQVSGSAATPAPVATVTLISHAPAHDQAYSLINMAQEPITHRVEREGAGYRVTFQQQWGQQQCAYRGPGRAMICRLPLFSHRYYWQLVYHLRGTSVSKGTFSTNYDGY